MQTAANTRLSLRTRLFVRAEQVQIIYRQALPAMMISTVVAALVCAILWNVTPHSKLVAWFAAIVLMAVARSVIVFFFKLKSPQGLDILRWEPAFVVSLVLSALVWGVGGLFVMPDDSTAHQAVVYFFLMGMTGGSAAMYSAHTAGTNLTIFSILLPATVWLFFRGELIPAAMAAGGLIYTLSTIRATRTLSYFLHRSFQLSHELKLAHAAAERTARTDELTQLPNRRAFAELGGMLFSQCAKSSQSVSALILDIDYFKQINDTRGHAAGDQALRVVSRILKSLVPDGCIVCRLGGEEFAMLLPGEGMVKAAAIAENIREAIASAVVSFADAEFVVSVSIGAAEGGADLEDLLHRADQMLYRAKASGRNRVVTA